MVDTSPRQRRSTVAVASHAAASGWSATEFRALQKRHKFTGKLLDKAKIHTVERTASAVTALEEDLRGVKAELAVTRSEKASLGAAWAMTEATIAEARTHALQEARIFAVGEVAQVVPQVLCVWC